MLTLFLTCAAILATAARACGALCVCAPPPLFPSSPLSLPSHTPRARYTYPIALSASINISHPKSYVSEQVWMDGEEGGDLSNKRREARLQRGVKAAARQAADAKRAEGRRLTREAKAEAERLAAEEEAKRVAAEEAKARADARAERIKAGDLNAR